MLPKILFVIPDKSRIVLLSGSLRIYISGKRLLVDQIQYNQPSEEKLTHSSVNYLDINL